MKYKTTNKAIKSEYRHILSVIYCDAQHLLSKRYPIACASGAYGWNFDLYDVGDIVPGACICTGYRPPKGSGYDKNLLRDYESRAKSDPERIESLLTEFVQNVLEVKS